jgi:hypothetical protein
MWHKLACRSTLENLQYPLLFDRISGEIRLLLSEIQPSVFRCWPYGKANRTLRRAQMTDQNDVQQNESTADKPAVQERRNFLRSLGKWSQAVIGGVLTGGVLTITPVEAQSDWNNGAGGWGNRDSSWYNRGGGWYNRHGGGWYNRHGGGWHNRRGGGDWYNR